MKDIQTHVAVFYCPQDHTWVKGNLHVQICRLTKAVDKYYLEK